MDRATWTRTASAASATLFPSLLLLLLSSLVLLFPSPSTVVTALLPLDHLSRPSPVWNQAVRSSLGNGNVVQISPDDRWVYVTSSDGSLSKLDPAAGNLRDLYSPERLTDEDDSGTEREVRGYGGISFHMAKEEEEEEEDGQQEVPWEEEEGTGGESQSYLVYWVLDVPTNGASSGKRPRSRVIAARHDSSEEIEVLWTKVVDGTIVGTPAIGSEGRFIYFTMNSSPAPPATSQPTKPITSTPTTSPVADPVTDSPSKSPVTDSPSTSPVTDSPSKSPVTGTPTAAPVPAETASSFTLAPAPPPSDATENTDSGSDATDPPVSDGPERDLQADDDGENSGFFLVLDHAADGEVVYRFDSRSDLNVNQHLFAPAEIARSPARGNYYGGEGNGNDVVVWGSMPDGTGGRQGETLLFQLPAGFDAAREEVDVDDFEVQVLETVPWTTLTKPALSADGQDLYFALGGNRLTGWNNGRRFDVVANLGPQPLPGGVDSGYPAKPIVLVDDDQLLLATSPTHDILTASNSDGGSIAWVLGNIGQSPFTTPRGSPDGAFTYFGKQNSVYAVSMTDGSMLWGPRGYMGSSSDFVMAADISLSPDGQFLYYNSFGTTISKIQISNVVPTQVPTTSPTLSPSFLPSLSPSASFAPSTSAAPSVSSVPTFVPSTSMAPSNSTAPTGDTPTASPTASSRPSGSPSGYPTDSPSSDAPTSSPFVMLKSPSPTKSTSPTEDPTANPTNTRFIPPVDPVDPPSSGAAAELPDDSKSTENSLLGLSQTAIIGIAVGGGVGLILLIAACIYFVRKRKGSDGDDGVDTDWNNPDENFSAEDTGTRFTYGSGGDDEESKQPEGNLQW